jgi:hypothetical protein
LARPRRHPEHVIGAGRTPARCRPAGGAVLTKPAPSGMPILPAAAQGGDGLEPIGIRAAGSAGARCTVTTSAAGPAGSHLRDRDLAVLGRGDSAGAGATPAGRRPPGNGTVAARGDHRCGVGRAETRKWRVGPGTSVARSTDGEHSSGVDGQGWTPRRARGPAPR